MEEKLLQFFKNMTEVYISALTTTRIDLNEEDKEFYKEEKKKEIFEVRYCLDYLHQFSSYSPKERMQTDLPLVWKSITYLAKILDYQDEFLALNKLHLPEIVLLQDLFYAKNLFSHRAYRSLQVIDRWNTDTQKYVVLLSGMIEKESFRTSIFETNVNHKSEGGMLKSKKNGKKRFNRTEEQIPICINSKRSQIKSLQQSGLFRSVTSSETFEVNISLWKKFVSTFKTMEQHYIENFIRKKLDINLNLSLIAAGSKNEVENQEKEEDSLASYYSIETFQRNQDIQLDNIFIYVLYLGEVLVISPHYRIESTGGCVLNSQIFHYFSKYNFEKIIFGSAKTKTEATLIKINLKKMQVYFDYYPEDKNSLTSFLSCLEKTRREKVDIPQFQKLDFSRRKSSKSILKSSPETKERSKVAQEIRNSVAKMFNVSPKRTIFLPNCKGAKKNFESKNQPKSKKNIFSFDQIEKRIQKQEKAAQLLKTEYSKKIRQTEPSISENIHPLTRAELEQYESYSILNSVLLKDSMMCINARSDMLKKTVLQHRKKRIQEGIVEEKTQFQPTHGQIRIKRDTSSEVIKRKIKEIYFKTEESQFDSFPLTDNLTERDQEFSRKDFHPRGTAQYSIQSSCSNQNLWITYGEYMPQGRGVLKKIQRGQIRRVR